MKKKLFRGFPSSLAIGLLVFAYLSFVLWYVSQKGSALSTLEFYMLTTVYPLFLVAARGTKILDYLGFDLNRAPLHIRFARLLIVVVVGVLVGFGVYYLQGHLARVGLRLFPFDLFYLQLTVDNPLAINVADNFIIALFEETIRIIPALSFANWFYKKGIRSDDSIVYGFVLASFFFILCHFWAWGPGLNLVSAFVMSGVVVLFSILGLILKYKEFWGPITFLEFSLIPSIISHFVYDLSISLNLRAMPGILSLAYLRLFPI